MHSLPSLLIDSLLDLVMKAPALSNEDGQMPKVGSTHYAYTAAGKKAAAPVDIALILADLAAARKAGKSKSKPKPKKK